MHVFNIFSAMYSSFFPNVPSINRSKLLLKLDRLFKENNHVVMPIFQVGKSRLFITEVVLNLEDFY